MKEDTEPHLLQAELHETAGTEMVSSRLSSAEGCSLALFEEDEEKDERALSSYPLSAPEGRYWFLEKLAWIGEPAIFEAVSHVWDWLAEPRTARCTHMGLLAGTGGKNALLKVLLKYLDEYLEMPQVSPVSCQPLAEWHHEVMGLWADERSREIATVWKYVSILDGKGPTLPQEHGGVINGHWTAKEPPLI